MTSTITPGFKTRGFWLATVATLLGAFFATGLADSGTAAQVAGLGATVLAAFGYSVARGFVKADGSVVKPGWKKSEFWLALVAFVVAGLTASGAFADSASITQVLSVVGGILAALGYGVSKQIAGGRGAA